MASVTVHIHCTDTIEEAFKVLARVCTVQTGGTSQWVTFEVDGVQVNFFGPSIPADEPAETIEPESIRA